MQLQVAVGKLFESSPDMWDKVLVYLNRPYYFRFFKECLPQI